MIRTVLVEDSPIAQKYLLDMLKTQEGFQVIAVFSDAFEAEKLCVAGGIDLVLMDVQTLHNHSGLAVGKRILEQGGNTKVVAVTSLVDPDILAQAKAGAANSLWYKDHGSSELMEVIHRTLEGERIFPDRSPNIELKEMFSEDITPRQLNILRRFVKGMTLDEIAEELKLTRNGVRWNLNQIIEKGGFENKYELFVALVSNKLIVTSLMQSETE